MGLDSSDRSFLGLVAVALVAAYLALGVGGCVLLSLVGYRVAAHGVGVLIDGDQGLLLAVVFLAIVGAGGVRGLWSLRRQVLSSVRLPRRVRVLAIPAPAKLSDLAWRIGLGGRVTLVDSAESFSFVYGAITPRVAVSRGLFEALSPIELAAVLEHESYHVRNLDPLKVLLSRTLSCTFFYLPVLRGLQARYMAGRELAADRRAINIHGRGPLAGALFKVAGDPGWSEVEVAASIGGPELLDIRVAQLETGAEPRLGGISAGALTLSLLGTALLAAAFFASVIGFGGPSAVVHATMPAMTPGPLDVVLAVACAVPWLVGGWFGYRCLAWRARQPTT